MSSSSRRRAFVVALQCPNILYAVLGADFKTRLAYDTPCRSCGVCRTRRTAHTPTTSTNIILDAHACSTLDARRRRARRGQRRAHPRSREPASARREPRVAPPRHRGPRVTHPNHRWIIQRSNHDHHLRLRRGEDVFGVRPHDVWQRRPKGVDGELMARARNPERVVSRKPQALDVTNESAHSPRGRCDS